MCGVAKKTMPKRRSSSKKAGTPLLLVLLAVLALLIFGGGELYAFLRSDGGRMFLWRHLHVGDRAHAVRIVGRHVREGLATAGARDARVKEEVLAAPGGPAVRWRVELPADGSPTQANFAITQAVEKAGAEVLAGDEESGENGGQVVAAGTPEDVKKCRESRTGPFLAG